MNIVKTTTSLQKISIGAIIKNPESLKSFPDHLKTKEMCKNAVKKLQFIIRYVPDRYKSQEMCDDIMVENGRTLVFFSDCYKNQGVIKVLIIILTH